MQIETWVAVVVAGVGATATIDAWSLLRRALFNQPMQNWALVGRWLGHLAHGQLTHRSLAAAKPIPMERLIGWAGHYAIGIGFAALLAAWVGRAWFEHPTLPPAVIVGVASVAAPFLILQPGMGAGVAGSNSPSPAMVRFNSLVTHTIFGWGLYFSASLMASIL